MMAASQRSQGRGRSPATQAAPGTISASATVSQPFSSAKVSVSAKRRERTGRDHCACGHKSGTLLAPHQRFRRQPIERGKKERQARERQRAVQCGNPIVERDQHRERRNHAGCGPQHRHQSARRAALRQKSGAAEQRRPKRGQREMRAVVEASGLGDRRRRRAGRREQCVEIHVHRPMRHDRDGEECGHRHGGGRGLGAPGDADSRDGENDEGRERDRDRAGSPARGSWRSRDRSTARRLETWSISPGSEGGP